MTRLGFDTTGARIQAIRPGTITVVAYTGTAGVMTLAVGAATTLVRIVADTDCYYAVGAAPTATTSSTFLPAKTIEYVSVNPGSDKLSFVQSAAGGNANITEGA